MDFFDRFPYPALLETNRLLLQMSRGGRRRGRRWGGRGGRGGRRCGCCRRTRATSGGRGRRRGSRRRSWSDKIGHRAKSSCEGPFGWISEASSCRSALVCARAPIAAPQYPEESLDRAFGIGQVPPREMVFIPVQTPFINIAVHVVQAKGVWHF